MSHCLCQDHVRKDRRHACALSEGRRLEMTNAKQENLKDNLQCFSSLRSGFRTKRGFRCSSPLPPSTPTRVRSVPLFGCGSPLIFWCYCCLLVLSRSSRGAHQWSMGSFDVTVTKCARTSLCFFFFLSSGVFFSISPHHVGPSQLCFPIPSFSFLTNPQTSNVAILSVLAVCIVSIHIEFLLWLLFFFSLCAFLLTYSSLSYLHHRAYPRRAGSSI
jgi:hypothetical protein